jgi:hypothetical protein
MNEVALDRLFPPDTAGHPYVGLEQDEALAVAGRQGIVQLRMHDLDDDRPFHLDHRPDRLNLAVKDGRVIRASYF